MRNKFLILTALILLTSMEESNAQKEFYSAMDIKSLSKINDKKFDNIDHFYQLKSNMALVTIYKDGTVTLFPASGGEGLYADDIKYLEPMIASGVYPVKGDGSFFEKEKTRIANLRESIPYYCAELSKKLDFDVKVSLDPIYLERLSVVITKRFSTKRKDYPLAYLLSVYVGELMRVQEGAEYIYRPENTLNIYYTPELTKDGKFCTFVGEFIRELEIAHVTPVNVGEFLSKRNDFYPILTRRYIIPKL